MMSSDHKTSVFTHFARRTSSASGRPLTFMLACTIILVWALTGPLFGFSDTWQLVINTGTTIITFLMVFLIQNTQNRDTEAMQIKIDELIRAVKGARNEFIDLEEMDESQLEIIHKEYVSLAEHARQHMEERGNRRRHGRRS